MWSAFSINSLKFDPTHYKVSINLISAYDYKKLSIC